jgi:DNA invertase Pin-like site-specific DNA recombinase
MYEICKILVDRGVHVFSVKDNQILDLSADGKFRLAMYCYFAEKERERCSERTKEALTRIKATGKHIGRPLGACGKLLKLEGTKDYIFQLVDSGYSVKRIADKINCGSRTISDFLKKYNVMTKQQIKYHATHNPEKIKEIGEKVKRAHQNKILMLEYAAE